MSKATHHLNTLPAHVSTVEHASIFYFDGLPIRVVARDGRGLFVVDDICKAIGTVNPSSAASALAADQKVTLSLADDERNSLRSTEGKARGTSLRTVVTEGGMYTLVLRSRDATKEGTAAYRFSRFVTDEVLPAIRRTGSYNPPSAPASASSVALLAALRDPHAVIALVAHHAQERIVAEQRAEVAEATVEEQRPMVDAYMAFLDDDRLCGLATAARAIDAPERLFFAWLRERGFAFDRDGFLQPRADLRRDGYLKVKIGPSDYGRRRPQTMVTQAGLAWLRHRWIVGPGRTLALQASIAAKQASLPGL